MQEPVHLVQVTKSQGARMQVDPAECVASFLAALLDLYSRLMIMMPVCLMLSFCLPVTHFAAPVLLLLTLEHGETVSFLSSS